MNKYICIHGHFYQPPRENPWLEEVELQDSAYPYHDWNERITAECYAPNTASRIMDTTGKVIVIGNNYSQMSFNFGPTLLSWMERHAKDIYGSILQADKLSKERFSGHGSALAQGYSHMILPLANARDKYTQIFWGIRDFQKRFDRLPEGVWLPEAAVDLETLDIIASLGLKFTILSPHTAKAVRHRDAHDWADVSGGRVDPKMPYFCRLPSGRTIALFFYDGPIAQDIAFGTLLDRGENLAQRLLSAFSGEESPQLVHIATDGETYGHHHRFGDMALAYCLHYLETNNLAKAINYGEYLERFPPAFEARIFENTSWSCAHGVERWRANCGCNTGMHPGWNQEWRHPLREALDWLRDQMIPLYEKESSRYFADPWAARNDYIDVILDRSPASIDSFFGKYAHRPLNDDDKVRALELLEIQRNAQLMYTSCGWFFDEVSGLESVQVLQYSCRALQLAQKISGLDIETAFRRHLAAVPTNIPEFSNGEIIYQRFVKPAEVDFLRVGSHYAISALFDEYPENIGIYCYSCSTDIYDKKMTGKSKLFICRSHIRSDITCENRRINAAVLHLGDQNIDCGVRYYENDDSFAAMQRDISGAFDRGNILETIRFMERHFGSHNYSLSDLFKDEQRKILSVIVQPTIENVKDTLRGACDTNCFILDIYQKLNIPIPRDLFTIIEFRVNADLEKNLLDGGNVQEFAQLSNEVRRWGLGIDRAKIGLLASTWFDDHMQKISATSVDQDATKIEKMARILQMLNELSIPLNLWKTQNIYFSLDQRIHQQIKEKAAYGDAVCQQWISAFHLLGEQLKVRDASR